MSRDRSAIRSAALEWAATLAPCWSRASTARLRRRVSAELPPVRALSACVQLEAVCTHVKGTRRPLADLESLVDAAALQKACLAEPLRSGGLPI